MNKYKILYVVSRPLQINTSASIRNRATILGLLENGNQVDLITTKPDSKHIAFDSSMEMASVKCSYVQLRGVQSVAKIGRRFAFLKPFYKFFKRFFRSNSIYDNLLGIINYTSIVNLKEENYDFIISSSDPKSSHVFVEKLLSEQGEEFHGKWIQIWGDPFYDDITLPKNIDRRIIQLEEERLLNLADKVVYVSKLTLSKQQLRYSNSAKKMDYYPIPYNKEIISPIRNLEMCDNVKLAYCGDYPSSVRNIIPLYNAICDMDDKYLTIYGMTDLCLQQQPNIVIKPRQTNEDVERLEIESDILIHLSNLSGGQIPGKIYQYSGTNKPILFILDGDKDLLKNEFAKYNRFYFADNNKSDIMKMIVKICKDQRTFKPVVEFSKKIISNNILS